MSVLSVNRAGMSRWWRAGRIRLGANEARVTARGKARQEPMRLKVAVIAGAVTGSISGCR